MVQDLVRRSFLLSTLLALCFGAVQVLLVVLVVFGYREVINDRIGQVSLTVQAAILDDAVESGRPWPEIEKRMQARFEEVAGEDEMAFYDASGHMLARSASLLAEIPAELSVAQRGELSDGAVHRLDVEHAFGVVPVATAREVSGNTYYLVRVNATFHNTSPWLLRFGLVALLVPLLLLGLGGALAVVRLAGRQLAKVDRVLRIMAGGDLSARLSLPVDQETAGVVLSFNRMAEKVERTIEKLRRSDESRRQLLADVTHELNTPLTSVLGYLETLCMEDLPLSPERRQRLTNIAYEEAVNLRALIEDLTTLSRLDAEGLPIEKTRVDLSQVVEQVVRQASHKAEGKDVPLRTDLVPGVAVMGDAHRLGQVVRNLVENALRHTQPPGDVTAAVLTSGTSALIEIRDRGTGISRQDLTRMGQRFLRLDKSRARHTGGRGLGLSICVGLVEAHGGTIRFESELGQGTTVRVKLPLAAPVAAGATLGTALLEQPEYESGSVARLPESIASGSPSNTPNSDEVRDDETPLPAPVPELLATRDATADSDGKPTITDNAAVADTELHNEEAAVPRLSQLAPTDDKSVNAATSESVRQSASRAAMGGERIVEPIEDSPSKAHHSKKKKRR